MSRRTKEPRQPAEAVITIEYRVELNHLLEDRALEEVMDKLREMGSAEVIEVSVANYRAAPTLESIIKLIKEA